MGTFDSRLKQAYLHNAIAECTICNMDMRPIQESDYNEIQSWLDYQKPEHVDVDLRALPPSGIIAPGISCFFYTMTNGPVMWIDTFISNPRAELAKRREAGRIFAAIIHEIAKANKIKRMFFLTRNPAVERVYSKMLRAQEVGTFKLFKTEYIWD